MSEYVARKIVCLANKIKRSFQNLKTIRECNDLNGTRGRIIAYLYDNVDNDIYQKDIEKEFGITRSTASNILSGMEDNGYIKRISVSGDLRLKKLALTDKSIAHHKSLMRDIEQFESSIDMSLTDDEIKFLDMILDKIEKGVKKDDKDID